MTYKRFTVRGSRSEIFTEIRLILEAKLRNDFLIVLFILVG